MSFTKVANKILIIVGLTQIKTGSLKYIVSPPKNVIKIPKNITILARKGYAWQRSLLDKINLEKAKQVIILKPDISELYKTEMDCDVEVGKSVSSIIASKEYNNNCYTSVSGIYG